MTETIKLPERWPYGAGSIQRRGRSLWILYRDGEGRQIQENTRTEDPAEALRILAAKAVESLQARIACIEACVHETPKGKATPHQSNDGDRNRGRSGRSAGVVPAPAGKRAAKKTGGRK